MHAFHIKHTHHCKRNNSKLIQLQQLAQSPGFLNESLTFHQEHTWLHLVWQFINEKESYLAPPSLHLLTLTHAQPAEEEGQSKSQVSSSWMTVGDTQWMPTCSNGNSLLGRHWKGLLVWRHGKFLDQILILYLQSIALCGPRLCFLEISPGSLLSMPTLEVSTGN